MSHGATSHLLTNLGVLVACYQSSLSVSKYPRMRLTLKYPKVIRPTRNEGQRLGEVSARS